jgi:thiol-disulfide isomerase/thioredoxin
VSWDRAQLVGLSVSLRSIVKASYARHCINTTLWPIAIFNMRAASIIFFGLFTILSGCKNKSEFQIRIEVNRTNYDTLFVQELVTARTIAKVPLNKLNKDYSFNIDEATLGSLSVIGTETTYLTIIKPGVKKTILIDSTSLRTKQSIPDSLVNYLWKSTNQMFSQHDKVIFAQDNPQKVKFIFDSLVQVRHEQLNKFKSQLTADEFGILDYQNKARAYSFLMFYGRIVKRYSPDNDFFSFISNIDNESIYSKSLPDNILYKYEIMILKEKESIENIDVFLKFIETQTTTIDLQDFLKAMYLKSVIEHPSYWRRHENLFTTNTIKDAFKRESTNKYSYLINRASNSFYASQKGVKGYDFAAFKLDGTELKLSDLKGKIVVIDTWATWCGPCIDQRPNMIELAKKYKDNPGVVFLMVSVDNSVARWKKYVTRTNGNGYGIEVNIPDGMNGEFGDKYLIKAIPKYILLDKEGIIIDSNLPDPSIVMEQLIERVSEKL